MNWMPKKLHQMGYPQKGNLSQILATAAESVLSAVVCGGHFEALLQTLRKTYHTR